MTNNLADELDQEDGNAKLIVVEYEDAETTDNSLDEFGMTPEDIKALSMQLRSSITEAEQASQVQRQRWQKWRRQIEAVAQPRMRNINPLRDASNVMPPLTQIHAQTMAANLINYFGQDPFWSWTALKDDDHCRALAEFATKYFKVLSTSVSDLNLEPVKRTICADGSALDLCAVKVPYTTHQWAYRKNDATGTAMKTMIYHEGPELVPIPREDFIFPAQWNDIRYMPWVAHIIHLPEHELRLRGEIGDYENVEEVLGHGRETPLEAERTTAKLRGQDSSDFDTVYDLAEVYFYHDADGDGQPEDYVWTIDLFTGVVLQRHYNEIGMRPFEIVRYIERPHDLSGRGVGQICEGLQDEACGIHNVRNDNMKIANMRMLTMSRATKNANGEEIYPGKIWINDTDQEIKTLQLGEVYPSSLQAEEQTWHLAAQATGQSEVQRGFGDPTLGQRDTFRGQQMRMASSKGIFGTIADGMKESFSRMGFLVMLQLINHKEEVLARETRIGRITPDEMVLLEELLSFEPSDVPSSFAYNVRTVDDQADPGYKMQAIVQFAQLYSQWGQQSSQLAMQLFTPQGQMMAQQAPQLYQHFLTLYTGSARFMEQVLKLTGVENDPSAFIPNVDMFEHLISVMNDATAQKLKFMEAQNGARSLGGYDQSNAPSETSGNGTRPSAAVGGGAAGASSIGAGAGQFGAVNAGAFQSGGMGNPAGTSG